MLLALIVLVLICVGFYLWNDIHKSMIIGKIGELYVNEQLSKLNKYHYRIISDLLLPSKVGLDTTQIDHVVISTYGIFCIETKTIKGTIFGNAYSKYWKNGNYPIYSPLKQNYKHKKSIEDLLSLSYPDIPIYSFVILPRVSKINIYKITGTDLVGSTNDIIEKINSIKKNIISMDDLDIISSIISDANIKDRKIRKSHNRSVGDIRQRDKNK